MNPDNKLVPDMAIDDEDHNDSFGTFGKHYTESGTQVKPGRILRWIMMASAGAVIALSIAYSGHVKQLLPFAKNWQIWVSGETVSTSAQKISTDTRITAIPAALPLDLRPDHFTDVQQALPLPPPIDNLKITQL
jgi:hypothetical protein